VRPFRFDDLRHTTASLTPQKPKAPEMRGSISRAQVDSNHGPSAPESGAGKLSALISAVLVSKSASVYRYEIRRIELRGQKSWPKWRSVPMPVFTYP